MNTTAADFSIDTTIIKLTNTLLTDLGRMNSDLQHVTTAADAEAVMVRINVITNALRDVNTLDRSRLDALASARRNSAKLNTTIDYLVEMTNKLDFDVITESTLNVFESAIEHLESFTN